MSNILDNLDFIQKVYGLEDHEHEFSDNPGDSWLMKFLDEVVADHSDEQLEKMFSGWDALRNKKIVSFLGFGGFGAAFLLNDDHVLKIFEGGVGKSAVNEKELYDLVAGAQGRGTIGTRKYLKYFPRIYETGCANNGLLCFIEMSRVIPIQRWLDTIGVDSRKFNVATLWKFVRFEMKKEQSKSVPKRDIMRSIFEAFVRSQRFKAQDMFGSSKSDRRMAKSRLKNLLDNKKLYVHLVSWLYDLNEDFGGMVTDLHSGNFGVDPARPETHFVFYDVL